jgi:hypothetical protein
MAGILEAIKERAELRTDEGEEGEAAVWLLLLLLLLLLSFRSNTRLS